MRWTPTMTIGDLIRNLRKSLDPIYGGGESKAIIRLAFHSLYGWDQTQIIIREDREASDFMQSQFSDILKRLANHEPIQYILGEAEFYGMTFKIEPGILIPRPETAELVDWIVDTLGDRKDLRVLDAGTGSGCIAISLSRNLPFSRVTAIDLSPIAVTIARENAATLHADINIKKGDIFNFNPPRDSFDVIVSNPPYIAFKEREKMDANVVDYEPSTALFVPDDDPLLFYRRIADIAMTALTKGGHIFFEINPLYADELSDMMADKGFDEIQLRKDMYDKTRFLHAIKSLSNKNETARLRSRTPADGITLRKKRTMLPRH